MSSRTTHLLWSLVLAAGTLVPAAAGRPAPRAAAPPARPEQVLLTMEEALELAFPKCDITRETHYLTKEQQKKIARLVGDDFKTGVVYSYVARKDGRPVGTAWFDRHRVRTLCETVMVVVAPDSTIARVEVLSFGEPREYLPKKAWYEQFEGRKLDEDLSLKRKIRSVTGATLTATATTACARRVLALHQFLASPATPVADTKDSKDGEPRR